MVIKEFNILMLKSPLNQERYKILLMIYFLIYRNLLEFITFVQSYFHYLKDLRDFGLDKGGVDPFSPKYRLSSIICDVFSNQFDLNLFMITTENSSIFCLLTKESMLLTSATFLIEKRS